MTKSVYKTYLSIIDLHESKADYIPHTIDHTFVATSIDKSVIFDGSFTVKAIHAKHEDLQSDGAVGFAFIFDKTALVYTGDTGVDGGIIDHYGELADDLHNENKKIVLLAHIGGFHRQELNCISTDVIPKDDTNIYYPNHLGRAGLARLVEILEPKVCIISEFGEELGLYRERLAMDYQQGFQSTTRTKFLPADIGLVFHLEDMKVCAISKIVSNKSDYDFGLPVDPGEVATCRVISDNSLHYYSKKLVGQVGERELSQMIERRGVNKCNTQGCRKCKMTKMIDE